MRFAGAFWLYDRNSLVCILFITVIAKSEIFLLPGGGVLSAFIDIMDLAV